MFSKALFIGIDKYNSKNKKIKNLEGCVSDMYLMKETVTDVFGSLPKDTLVLTNHRATTQNILDSLEHLVEELKPGEQVFMYYAGHGGQVPNVSRNEEDAEAYDQILVPHDFSKTEPLLDDILQTYFNRVPEGAKFIMILDSCHAGGMARALIFSMLIDGIQRKGWTPRSIGRISRTEYSPIELQKLGEYKKRYMIEKSKSHFILLAAAQPHELAWERFFGEEKHGIFTYHLHEILKEKKASLTPVNLINYAYSKIKTYRKNQMPRLIGNEALFNKPLFKI